MLENNGNNKDLYSVANKFITIAKEEGTKLSAPKLINLVYLAYCHYLDKKDRSLFSNDIEATKHGPTIPVLREYFGNSYKMASKNPSITETIPTEQEEMTKEDALIEEEIDRFLSYIYTVYGNLSDYNIIEFTGKIGSPSSIVYQDQAEKLPDHVIKTYYNNIEKEQEKMAELDVELDKDIQMGAFSYQ